MNKKKSKSPYYKSVHLVSMSYYRIILAIFRPIISYVLKMKVKNQHIIPKRGPMILLINHISLFDPLGVYAMLRRPINFVATEDLFRNRLLRRFLYLIGVFPKRKASSDIRAISNCINVIKHGSILGIFPEGIRSWDGSNSPITPSLALLIQKLKVPVYCCRLEGSYLSLPRWASKHRKIPVTGIFRQLYKADEIPEDKNKMIKDIAHALKNNEYNLSISPGRYWRKGLAVNVSKLIYRCPVCKTFESLKVVRPLKTNQVECSSCFSSWKITPSCRMIPVIDNTIDNSAKGLQYALITYYKKIKKFPLPPLKTRHTNILKEDECLYLMSRPYILKTEGTFSKIITLGKGRIYLTNKRFIFKNRIDTIINTPLNKIQSLSTDPGDRLCFEYNKKLYIIQIKTESILKWYDTILRLQERV